MSEGAVSEPKPTEAAAPAAIAAEAELNEKRALAKRIVEALVFASPEPLTEKALAERLPEGSDVKALLAELREAIGATA